MFASFAAYAERIELETFFSGFPVIYALYWLCFQKGRQSGIAYALVATLYWALQFKNYYPDYNLHHIISSIDYPLLKAWGLIAILFWIPALRKNSVITLLHSLVFFVLMIDGFLNQQNNALKVFAASLLINSFSLILILLVTQFRRVLFSLEKFS
jgi:hypothetical protein